MWGILVVSGITWHLLNLILTTQHSWEYYVSTLKDTQAHNTPQKLETQLKALTPLEIGLSEGDTMPSVMPALLGSRLPNSIRISGAFTKQEVDLAEIGVEK